MIELDRLPRCVAAAVARGALWRRAELDETIAVFAVFGVAHLAGPVGLLLTELLGVAADAFEFAVSRSEGEFSFRIVIEFEFL